VQILSRQFLASYLTLYFATLAASLLVVGVIEMMLNLDDALESSQGLAGIGIYLFLRLPSYYLPYLIPVSSFVAAFLCLGLPARSQEIVAIKAGGIAPQRLCLPVLLAAGSLAILTLALNETLVLESSNRFESWKHGDKEDEIFAARSAFWYSRGPYLYRVQEADSATRTLQDVRVYERGTDGRLLRTIVAASARIAEDNRWHLQDAVFRSFEPDDPSAPPTVRREQNAILEMSSERELALLQANASTLSLPRLIEYIEAITADGRDPTRYRALFHSRLAEPLTVLLFALLAIPLALAVEHSRSLATAAVRGIALIGVFYTLQTVAAIVASEGVTAAIPGPWILLVAFGVWGSWRFARVPA
jgi:lipopolysaccharide export system permease protein